MKLIRLLLTLSLFVLPAVAAGCSVGFKPDYSKQEIVEIEFMKVEHPYLRGVVDRKVLASTQINTFYEDLQAAKAIGLTKIFTCFEFHVKTKDGKTRSFRTNGHIFSEMKNDYFYEFSGQENIILKYWEVDANCQ